MNVVILAAGYATRMYPLTRDHPKPLLDVGGRPVLSRLMDRVLTIRGVRHVVLVTNERFARQFRDWTCEYGSDVPIDVVNDGSTHEDDRLGALRDLALGWDAFPDGCAGDDVVVVGADNLIGFDVAPFAARCSASGNPLFLVREIDGEVPPGRYSEVCLDKDGTVTSFREKPLDPRSPLSCICFYFFTPEVRTELETYLAEGRESDAPGHFLAWLSTRRELTAERITGSWFDIGSLETLERARAAFDANTELK